MSDEIEMAWVKSTQGRFDSLKFTIIEMCQYYIDYIRRKDHTRMDKDKMIEMLDTSAMYLAEFLHILGAKKMEIYDQLVAFFQKTAHYKGLYIEGYLYDDLLEGNAHVLNEMKQEVNGDFV